MRPIALRYQLGPSEFLAKERLLSSDPWRHARWSVWKETLLVLALCVGGLISSFLAKIPELMLLFGVTFVARLTVPWEQRTNLKTGLIAYAAKRIRYRDVSLKVDEEGLREEVEGITSLAPWRTVKSFALVEHVLILELAGELWALIPKVAFLGEGAPSESEFVALLRQKGVPERSPNPESSRST